MGRDETYDKTRESGLISIIKAANYLAMELYSEAAEELKEAYKRDNNPCILWKLGWVYEARGDKEGALDEKLRLYNIAACYKEIAIREITGKDALVSARKKANALSRDIKRLEGLLGNS